MHHLRFFVIDKSLKSMKKKPINIWNDLMHSYWYSHIKGSPDPIPFSHLLNEEIEAQKF